MIVLSFNSLIYVLKEMRSKRLKPESAAIINISSNEDPGGFVKDIIPLKGTDCFIKLKMMKDV